MRDRIKRPKDKEVIFNKLRESSENKEGFFPTLKAIMMFASALGYKYNKKIPFESSSEPISLSVFDKEDLFFIDILALEETKDMNILDDDNENAVEKKYTIFEAYANGGLEIIDKIIFKDTGTLYNNFIQLIIKEISSNQDDEKSIDNLKDILKGL